MKKYLLLSLVSLFLLACSDKKDPEALSVSKKEFEFKSEAGSVDVNVTSNSVWTAKPAKDAEWCKVSPASGEGNGEIKITVDRNEYLEERSTIITVKSETLSKEITILQEALSREQLLEGNTWKMKSQNSGEAGYDDLVGMSIILGKDKKAVAVLNINVEGLGLLDKIDGTWKFNDNALTINGELMGMPVVLTLRIIEMSETLIRSNFHVNLPGMFPTEGIPVIFARVN